jgi:hypothetical protein
MPARPNARVAAPPITYCIDFVRTMLEDAGGFYPFGATIGWNSRWRRRPYAEERPNPQEIHTLLGGSFAAGAVTGNL